MRRRAPVAAVDVGRLASMAVADWIELDERVRLAEMLDDTRAGGDGTALARLAPGARYPATLIDDRDRALRQTERMVVAHRRRVDGWQLAASTRRDHATVAAEFDLGHLSEPGADGGRWTAAGRIV